MKIFLKKHTDSILLGLILLIALILRVYKLSSIPFMHDEFSAIFRTQFTSFYDLIEQGVKVDGHPPLIQVFLYYWIKIFGISEIWIKIPFIISGVLAVFLSYKIAKEWFGSSAAIIISLLIATLEYPVLYSQIARPYISGLFLVLFFLYFWNNLLFHREKKTLPNFIGYAVSGALAAYDHHFALLQIAIIGLSGLLFVKRKNLVRFLLANLALIILYLPNLSIFFAQLNLKGIEGWLSKPESDFIINYLYYSIHFSAILGIVTGSIFLAGIFVTSRDFNTNHKLIIVSILWFIAPFLVGYYYSVYVNAVLQYSVLIFAFPFLLFGIFGWIRNNFLWFKISSFIIISIASIYSLVYERKHYQIFYQSPYEKITENAILTTDSLGNNNCLTVFSMSLNDSSSTPARAFRYYTQKFKQGSNLKYISADLTDEYSLLQKSLENFTGDFVYYGYLSSANPEIYPLIKHYFPYVFRKYDFYGGNAVIFSKKPCENNITSLYTSVLSFETKVQGWSDYNQANLTDSFSTEGKYSYRFDSISEWGPSFTDTLFKIAGHTDYIDISVDVLPLRQFSNAFLVSSIDEDTVNLDWRSTPFNVFNIKPHTWTTVVHSIKLPDFKKNDSHPTLKFYIWNKEKQNFLIDNFKIEVRKGNPVLYWIVTKEVKSR